MDFHPPPRGPWPHRAEDVTGIPAGDVVMHFEHKAGEKLCIDYTGKKLSFVEKETGEVLETEVFIAILGASPLTYVEATLSQNKADFYGALAWALHYFGGVVQVMIPDNLKTAVKQASNYEALLNPTAQQNLTADEMVALLVEAEWTGRLNRKVNRHLFTAAGQAMV